MKTDHRENKGRRIELFGRQAIIGPQGGKNAYQFFISNEARDEIFETHRHSLQHFSKMRGHLFDRRAGLIFTISGKTTHLPEDFQHLREHGANPLLLMRKMAKQLCFVLDQIGMSDNLMFRVARRIEWVKAMEFDTLQHIQIL